jgi:hypothetical protein
MAACQAAIFEIWFHLGDAAVEDLHTVAFGAYDWTQANATEVLCRLAQGGVKTEDTARRIAGALPAWRHEQIMRVCGPVAALAAHSAVLEQAYDDLIDAYRAEDPADTFELVAAAARFSPARVVARYGDFLRGLMEGAGLEGRTAFDDGHVVFTEDGAGVVAQGGPAYPQVEDFHQIRAAVLLHELLPLDQDVTRRLEAWSTNHPEESARAELRKILAQPPERGA